MPLYFDGFSHTDGYNKDGIVLIICYKGSQVDFPNKYVHVISVSEYCIYDSKQCNPDHLDLYCLPNYPFRGSQYTKD